MKILELFSGTGHISDTFRSHGHKAWKVDWSKDLDANLHADIGTLSKDDVHDLCNGKPQVIWASPDCTTYSVAACFIHRNSDTSPKTEYAAQCDKINQHTIDLIAEIKPRYWFIENPRGIMRKTSWMKDIAKSLPGGRRYTVTYCQYGGRTMKPTDIWTNHPNPQFKPVCKNGDPCHNAAPQGSKTGTQGKDTWSRIMSGTASNPMHNRAIMRGLMPDEFIEHIVSICEK